MIPFLQPKKILLSELIFIIELRPPGLPNIITLHQIMHVEKFLMFAIKLQYRSQITIEQLLIPTLESQLCFPSGQPYIQANVVYILQILYLTHDIQCTYSLSTQNSSWKRLSFAPLGRGVLFARFCFPFS